MRLQPVPGEPALFIGGKAQALVVADIHLGIERELFDSGVVLPSQTSEAYDRLSALIEKSKAKRLVILGDLKHNVPATSRQEYREVPGFLAELASLCPVTVFPGNHDGGLADLIPEGVQLGSSKGGTLGGVGLVHGHTWPSRTVMKCKAVVIGHNHPTFVFKDGLEVRVGEPCWLRVPLRPGALEKRYPGADPEIIVMPSFTQLRGGTPVNEEGSLLGPLLSTGIADLDNAKVHLLDGTYLGTLKEAKG